MLLNESEMVLFDTDNGLMLKCLSFLRTEHKEAVKYFSVQITCRRDILQLLSPVHCV